MVAAATSERAVTSESLLKLRVMTAMLPEIPLLYSKSSVFSSASRAVPVHFVNVCVSGRLLRSCSVWVGSRLCPARAT